MWPKSKLSSMTPILMHCGPVTASYSKEATTSYSFSLQDCAVTFSRCLIAFQVNRYFFYHLLFSFTPLAAIISSSQSVSSSFFFSFSPSKLFVTIFCPFSSLNDLEGLRFSAGSLALDSWHGSKFADEQKRKKTQQIHSLLFFGLLL